MHQQHRATEQPLALKIVSRSDQRPGVRGATVSFIRFIPDSTVPRFSDLTVPESKQAAATPLRNENFDFEWWRSPHVAFGHCPGLDWLRSTRQRSFKSAAKASLILRLANCDLRWPIAHRNLERSYSGRFFSCSIHRANSASASMRCWIARNLHRDVETHLFE